MTCPECGMAPMGAACYHICPNSDHFYSPEQERYDNQFYGDDDVHERYASEIADMAHEADIADQMEGITPPAPMFEAIALIVVDTSDDLPF